MDNELCALLAARLAMIEPGVADPALRAAVAEARAWLAENRLRVTVAGRLSAGKSTLVNALLGQRLAATDALECTRVAVRYRSGRDDRAVVRRSGGLPDIEAVPRAGGGVPDTLPCPIDEVELIDVEAPNRDVDRHFTIIDTPGLDSPSALDASALRAVRRTDVLIYAFHDPNEADTRALTGFRAVVGGLPRAGGANTIAVYTKTDLKAAGETPERFERHLRHVRRSVRGLAADLVPVATRLAESVSCGVLTERHARGLLALADLPAASREILVLTDEEFLGTVPGAEPSPLSPAERAELWELLGLHGVRTALALAAAGIQTTRGLFRGLEEASGIRRLRAEMYRRLVAESDAHRATAVVGMLREELYGHGGAGADRLAALLREVERHPALRRARLAESARRIVAAGGPREFAPEDSDRMLAEIERLLEPGTDAERLGLDPDAPAAAVEEAAVEAVARWRARERRLPFDLAEHAAALRRVYEDHLPEASVRIRT